MTLHGIGIDFQQTVTLAALREAAGVQSFLRILDDGHRRLIPHAIVGDSQWGTAAFPGRAARATRRPRARAGAVGGEVTPPATRSHNPEAGIGTHFLVGSCRKSAPVDRLLGVDGTSGPRPRLHWRVMSGFRRRWKPPGRRSGSWP
jgi:hypothetical protein